MSHKMEKIDRRVNNGLDNERRMDRIADRTVEERV
jgi:hypothetical protein